MRLVTSDDSAPVVPRARCRDLWAWEKAVLAAGDLDVKGRAKASTVKAVALAIRRHMNGPKKPDPGAGARPGTERLVVELGLARETVDRALSHLVKQGYLIREVAGCRNRRAVYAAALPIATTLAAQSVASTPHNQPDSVASAPHNAAECVARTPHLPKEVKTATTAKGQPQQLPIMATVTNEGGGGTPHGDQTTKPVGPTLRAVAESLPATLAAELLTDPSVDDVDQALTAIAGAGLPLEQIVEGCAGRLPDVVGNITALLLRQRIPTLQRRATGSTRAGDTKRHAHLTSARKIGDRHALAGDPREQAAETLALAYPGDEQIQAAGLEAYDHAITSIEQEVG